MIKKLSDYEAYLKTLLETGCPLTAEQLLSVRTHIGFFQHERLAHEIVLVLFALASNIAPVATLTAIILGIILFQTIFYF